MQSFRALFLGLAVALALPAGEAAAACTDDLKTVKEEFKKVRDARKKEMLRREISAADTALKRKNESGCKRSVANAQRIMKARP